ncbi:MAG: hypothetical protein ABGF52_08600 [Candidatus Asgardarchaeum sp.]
MVVSKGFSQELLDRISEQTSLTIRIGNLIGELMRLIAEKKDFLDFLKSKLGDGRGSIFLKMVRNRRGGNVYYYYYWRFSENGKRYDAYLGRHGYDSKILNYFSKRVNNLSRKLDEIVSTMYHLMGILRELDDLSKELQEHMNEKEEY